MGGFNYLFNSLHNIWGREMELPITKPSQVSYADELEFSDILKKMSEKNYDGFIRITHGSEEGYILFEDGNLVAASYDRYLKNEAVNKIEDAMEKSDSLVEVFDLKPSQISYLLDLNKAYKIEKKPNTPKSHSLSQREDISGNNRDNIDYGYEEKVFNPKEASYRQPIAKVEAEERAEYDRLQEQSVSSSSMKSSGRENLDVPKRDYSNVNESLNSNSSSKLNPVPENNSDFEESQNAEIPEKPDVSEDDIKEIITFEKAQLTTDTDVTDTDINNNNNPVVASESKVVNGDKTPVTKPNMHKINKTEESVIKPEKKVTESELSEVTGASDLSDASEVSEEIEEPKVPIDREELMKKYGLKDIQEEEVDKVLETYKGGTVSNADLERIELTIMNRIKQSVMGIPKIQGTEVMVFLDNTHELGGKIKIITGYEGKGIFSRIMGESKDIANLKYQIQDIVEMEIRKSFREYPQIVENFDINIEVMH